MKKTSAWIYNKEEAVFIDLSTGRFYAHICNDGDGKYYNSFWLTPWRAVKFWLRSRAIVVSVSFVSPLCIYFATIRLKCSQMKEAISMTENDFFPL